MIDTIITTMFVILLSIAVVGLIYSALEDELKKAQQWFEYRLPSLRKKLTPKTPIQKEIEAELKEIEQLEKQKEDIDKLKELKARKERLFEEVNEVGAESNRSDWVQVSKDEWRKISQKNLIEECPYCGNDSFNYEFEDGHYTHYCHACQTGTKIKETII